MCVCVSVCVCVSLFQLLKKIIFTNLGMSVITLEFIQSQIFVNTAFSIINNNMEDAQPCEVELTQAHVLQSPKMIIGSRLWNTKQVLSGSYF